MYGQTRIEFIFGIVIFSIIIFYIVSQINTVFSSNISDYEINNLKAEANSVIKVLTSYKGYPENWVNFLVLGWERRKEIEISLSSEELRDQQVRINVTYDSDMNSDFSDLRFTDSDKVTNIPYWIENKVDGSYADVWIKIPKIPESGKKSIYMYYSNSLANSESNGNKVFIQFLDLSGSSLPSNWVKEDIITDGTATVFNGILRITNTNGANVVGDEYEATHVYKNSTISGDIVAITKVINQKVTQEWAKAGITVQNFVIAKNYNGMAYITVMPFHYGLFWQSSSSYIAPNSYDYSGYAATNYPVYLKLIRNETYVSGWYSSNGRDWTQQGSYEIPIAIEDFQYVTLFVTPRIITDTGEANFSMFYVYQHAFPEPKGIIKDEEIKTNYSWHPIRTVGLAYKPNVLSLEKITALNENCDLFFNFEITDYRLKIYNSTHRLLFCGTDTLKPSKVVVNKNVLIENDLGNVTLELW